jgi:hypothetical protein
MISLQCIHALVAIKRQMRNLAPLDGTQHTLLARLSAINKGEEDILADGNLDFRPNDYFSPSVSLRGGLRMKEKCCTTKGQQAHAVRCLGEITFNGGGKMLEVVKKDAHAVRCLGEITFRGKMLEDDKKDAHTVCSLGEITFGGKMLEGKMLEGVKKEQHIQAGLARGASKNSKMEEVAKKEQHIQAGMARGASKSGKMETGDLLKVTRLYSMAK